MGANVSASQEGPKVDNWKYNLGNGYEQGLQQFHTLKNFMSWMDIRPSVHRIHKCA